MSENSPERLPTSSEPHTPSHGSRVPAVLLVLALWAVTLLVISATPPLAGIFIFPFGLFSFMSLPQGQQEATFAVRAFLWGGWAIYVGLSLWFVGTRTPGARVIIGALFVLVLALNIGGCAQLLNRMKHGF
jgi:hypothetical protein